MTRPVDASAQFFRSFSPDIQARLRLIVSPLLRISPTGAEVQLEGMAGLILTSARAVPFAGTARPIPVYCVGDATRRQAQEAGWPVQVCEPNAEALVQSLTAQKPPGPLLHIAGRHRRGDIAGRLSAQGIKTDEVVVYDQDVIPLTPEADAALSGSTAVIVPLFSPRTATAFAAQCTGSAPVSLVAISEAALQPTQHVAAIDRCCAREPTAEGVRRAVLAALRRVEAADTPR